ncbi:MAG: putative quinol monooxygenase [Pseudomonadota bacterium]
MYVVTVVFETETAEEAAFLIRVKQQARDSIEREAGCLRFDVATDPKRVGRVLLYEIYTSREAFDLHLASPHYRQFDADVAPMVRSRRVQTWLLA